MIRTFSPSPFFSVNVTATTVIYTLSLHDALPISSARAAPNAKVPMYTRAGFTPRAETMLSFCMVARATRPKRSEEHTSELQSRQYLVCRLLLEKKKCRTEIVSNNDCTTRRRLSDR